MHQTLWNVIKLISERKEYGEMEMMIAYEGLDTDAFSVLQEQFKEGLHMRSDQWI